MCPQNGIKHKAAINNSEHWLHTLIAALSLASGTICRKLPLNVDDNREDAYSHTGGIFIRDTARDTAYSL